MPSGNSDLKESKAGTIYGRINSNESRVSKRPLLATRISEATPPTHDGNLIQLGSHQKGSVLPGLRMR